MTYKCDKCNKIFKLRHHLTYHINKKISCEKVKDEQDNFKCLLCDKEYSFISGLIRHKKIHESYDEEVKKLDEKQKETDEINKLRELFITQDEKMRLVIDKQQKEIELLNKEIEELKMNNTKNNTINNTTNNNTINNNTINNNTTNIIIAFGSEEYECLNRSEIKKILFDHKIDPLLGMIEYIHFNDRLPQQQNIRYNNLRSKVIDVHNGNEWQMRNLDSVLDDLIENNIYNLDKIYEMQTDEHKPKIKQIVRCIIDDYYKHFKLDTEEKQDRDNKKLVEKMIKIINDVKLHVYNKSRNKKK